MKNEYSLFIGRYQPFHDGHKKLMEVVLNEGKRICIALRDTEIGPDNPHSITEREEIILKALGEWIRAGKVKIIIIPDITEV